MNIDLKVALPQLLPGAIEWAEAHSQHVASTGRTLNEHGLEIARSVGVQRPELIRISFVQALPLPTEPVLRQAALATGLLGPGMIGLTLGHSIYLVDVHISIRLISHECRHVYQYETFGSIGAFLTVYLDQIVTYGYENAPLEQDARAHERESS